MIQTLREIFFAALSAIGLWFSARHALCAHRWLNVHRWAERKIRNRD